MLRQPLVAEQSKISGALHARSQHRNDSGEQGDCNFNPEHRRTLQSMQPDRREDFTRVFGPGPWAGASIGRAAIRFRHEASRRRHFRERPPGP